MDKGTIIRTILLFIALVNQFLVCFGLYEIPGTAEEQTAFISAVFTFVTTVIAWFKNNYVTEKGKKQKDLLVAHNLAKKGDTLWSIAQTQGVTVEQLKVWNPGIDEKALQIGSKLNIGVTAETYKL
jgi:SPP1 family holin